MTAQRKITENHAVLTSDTTASLFDGDATQMFSSGSAPAARAQASAGDATEMFSSGSAPAAGGQTALGERTEMFSSGS